MLSINNQPLHISVASFDNLTLKLHVFIVTDPSDNVLDIVCYNHMLSYVVSYLLPFHMLWLF